MRSRPSIPLPRSLAPLHGESLAGFLLRLSYRLGQPPGHLAWRAGLAQATGITPARHLIMMTPDHLGAFSHTTRMSSEDAQRLTLLGYVATYPPISEALKHRGSQPPQPRGPFPAWLRTDATRYCPSCLAGDGSRIQALYGGAWKLLWHLPVVFACLEHQVLLQDLCPACHRPAQSAHIAQTPTLIPNPGKPGLHPLQCRNIRTFALDSRPLCGHRLDDRRDLSEVRLTPELAALQGKLVAHLLGNSEDPTAPSLAFSDIRVLAAIISATWPQSANLLELPPAVKGAFDEHSSEQGQAARITTTSPQRSSRHPSLWSTAPTSAPAMAALLSIADAIASQPVHEFRKTLSTLLKAAPHPHAARWGRAWRILQRDCSPLLCYEIEDAFRHRFPVGSAAGWSDRPDPTPCIIPGSARSYRAEHIPQELPDAWFDVLMEALTPTLQPRKTRWLRRAAAVQLVQAITRMSKDEAARYLGIPTSWSDDFLRSFLNRHHGVRPLLQDALEQLAEHVAALPQKVNYRERRDQFEVWHLPTMAWEKILTHIPRLRAAEHRPAPDGSLRACASAFVWSRLTGSEWALAPGFLNTPCGTEKAYRGRLYEQGAMRRILTGRADSGSPPSPSYVILGEYLKRYADSLILGRDTASSYPLSPAWLPTRKLS